MKFTKYEKTNYAEMERAILQRWKKDKTFEKSVEQRPADNPYVFYDGPPFITGLPHHGTLLPSIAKDVVPRYQTMKGHRVERRWGWDCHGLPAENFVEKKLGLKDKNAVLEYGLEKYITTCRESMIQTGSEWEDTIDRIGRWVEFKGAYKTMDKEYMESIWWAFKELYDKGKIYEGEKVLMYCTRCATPLSKAEIAMDNSYQDVTDPSVYVKFKLTDRDAYLLAWTTTPWTLHANVATAINADVEYTEVVYEGETFIMAKDLVEKVFTDEKHQPLKYKLGDAVSTKDLIGASYEPLFKNRGKGAHVVLEADYVTTEDGTGVVHLAPAYGEEDYDLAKQQGIPLVIDIDENGAYTDGPWKGAYVWEINKQIAKELKEQGVVWKIDYIRHSYPHCHRCGTKLMYRAHPSWFMDIAGQRKDMLTGNEDIEWFPGHMKHGRFHNTVESAPDWNLSRDRFWATPLPVWRSVDDNGEVDTIVVGSFQELTELSGAELEDYHRPWVDDVTFKKDGKTYTRIDKVIDCWFESGSMPFAQYHYPFENKEKFEASFPGDFIVEYVGQVRAWFYYLHAVSTALFERPAFKNVIVTGTVAGNDGRKMSKNFGNYTDPIELVDTYGADAYRMLLMGSTLMQGEDFALKDKDVADMYRKLNTLRSTLEFFLLYASADNWQATEEHLGEPKATNVLDRWILSRLNELIIGVEESMDAYDLPNAIKQLPEFIDDLSNWYVRRSRKRFWKSENDVDKSTAYHTLYFVLNTVSKVLAPFAPFISDEIHTVLNEDTESVHLSDWPVAGDVDTELTLSMQRTRQYITDGLAKRAQNQLKVRQPLSEVTIHDDAELDSYYTQIIAEELNVKLVHFKKAGEHSVELNTELTDELKQEGFVRELTRHIQELRKKSGLEVENRISLKLTTESEWALKAVNAHTEYISTETLATELITDADEHFEHESTETIGEHTVSISISVVG